MNKKEYNFIKIKKLSGSIGAIIENGRNYYSCYDYYLTAEINDAPLYRKKNCYIVEVQVPTAWFQLPNSMSFLSVSAYHDCKIKEFGSE